jgi:hypothetical protein
MPEKAIDKNPTGCLVLIVPTAFLIALIFFAWPVLLAMVVSIAGWGFWQNYEWQKLSDRVNPIFHELIVDRQGAVTPLDLAMKANLSGEIAQRYLERKANEFAAQKRTFADKGTVYYFLTVESLGSLFDESDPPQVHPDSRNPWLENESSSDSNHPLEALEPSPWDEEPQTEPLPSQSIERSETSDRRSTPKRLIQGELAKRLDVSSSTVYRRREDPDFAQWTRSLDPEGLAWRFSRKNKGFYPIETD